MAGIEMMQISRNIPGNKGTSQKNGRQDENVIGFGDLLRKKDALEDGQNWEKEPVSSGNPSSEQTEKEEEALDLNILMTKVLMAFQPVVNQQSVQTTPENGSDQGQLMPMPEVSGDKIPIFVPVSPQGNENQENMDLKSAGEMQPGTIQPMPDVSEGKNIAFLPDSPTENGDQGDTDLKLDEEMQSGKIRLEKMDSDKVLSEKVDSEKVHPGSSSGDAADGTVLRKSVSGEQSVTGEPVAADQNHKPMFERSPEEAEQTLQHTEGGMIQNRSIEQQPFSTRHQPVETLKTTPDTLPQDVAHMLGTRLPKGDGTLVIDLEPASLGKLTIEVVYEEGKAAVSILSSNPKTLELLSRSLSDIAYILEEKTGQETVIYTQETDRQPSYDTQRDQGRQEEQQDKREQKRETPTDSFAQQLRLGLV